MSLTKAQITNGILTATGTTSADWAAGALDLYANKSWWKIMDEFDFREKEYNFITPVTAGMEIYNITSIAGANVFDALQTIAIQDLETEQYQELKLITNQTYLDEFNSDPSLQAKPTHYFRRNDSIVLYPTPDQAYSLFVAYLKILSDIPDAGPVIPQAWHEAIQYGANYRAFADLGDMAKTQFWKSMYKDEISNLTPVKVKELSDTKFAGVEILGRDYP